MPIGPRLACAFVSTVLISLDGVAPRFVTPERMPRLCALARSGAACFTARTVDPPWTRPAHATMLRGVGPTEHGLVDNSLAPLQTDAPSVLQWARTHERVTATALNWHQMDTLIEPRAATHRFVIDSGYDPAEDDLMIDQLRRMFELASPPEVTFAYLCRADLAGHDHGWGSDPYLGALVELDRALGRLLEVIGPDASVVVTTDHGGVGNDHGDVVPDVMETFVVARSARIDPGSVWAAAEMADIAPTVADLAGLPPCPAWSGRSLVGTERRLVDRILEWLDQADTVTYGERCTMRAHSLQTAQVIVEAGGDDDLVVAALLHDVGHLMGDAGDWGLPDHAEVAARWLAPWLPATIVDPIRLHVAAKRHLVAVDPHYAAALSEASTVTLGQQGGPFDAEASNAFLTEPHAARAIMLRRADDSGKVADVCPGDGPFVERLARALADGAVDPARARAGCRCGDCVDAGSGQRLLEPADLIGWSVEGRVQQVDVDLVHLRRGETTHVARIPTPVGSAPDPRRTWGSEHVLVPRPVDELSAVAADLIETGVALVVGTSIESGTVLDIAERLGFVRTTNYGDLFDVRTEPEPINLAYSARGLGLHTDNPYRDPAPTVQLLHCLHPARTGGSSRISDGFAAAERLRSEEPEAFGLLTGRSVAFRFRSDEVDLASSRPIIQLDPGGRVVGVAVNPRSLVDDLDTPMTEALASFTAMLDDGAVEHRLVAGELLLVDNRRVLHARSEFDPSDGRHLQGCYIDIDAVGSLARLAGTAGI